MTRYFFNMFNDDITLADEGAELPDLEAAHAHAVKAARALAADSVVKGHLGMDDRIEVENEAHEVIDVVRYGDAVTIRWGPPKAAAFLACSSGTELVRSCDDERVEWAARCP